jgi:beta-glucosidase
VTARSSPLYVSENGAAFDDRVLLDRSMPDEDRIGYIWTHLAAVQDCLDAGLDVRSYFLWTWIDNFEWGHGYGPKFGIMSVDEANLGRHPKDRYAFSRSICSGRMLPSTPQEYDGLEVRA